MTVISDAFTSDNKMRMLVIITVQLFIISIVSCKQDKGDAFKEFLNDRPKRFSFEDAKLFLDGNEIELTHLSDLFINQKVIENIIRRTKEKNLLKNDNELIKYSIVCFENEIFDISFKGIALTDEEEYWKQDLGVISDAERKISLREFAERNEIDTIEMLKVLKHIYTYDLSGISKSKNNTFVKYDVEPFEGLIYKTSDRSFYGEIDTDIEIEPIKSSWFYFKDHF